MSDQITPELPVGSDDLVVTLPGFTPGPWHVGNYTGETNNWWVASEESRILGAGRKVSEANARLISAAPELLEVTEKMLRALECLAGPKADEDPVTVAARAAVAKAYGKNAPAQASRTAAACCACGSAMHMAVTGGTFWKCGSRKTRKGHFRTELCHAREALKHVHTILEDKRDQNSDLELGSTAFKSCLQWSSIYQHNESAMAPPPQRLPSTKDVPGG